ncbi:MAG: YdjY domain-containing protein [Planctomycetes bacterium]|nr:YdjY domain-containing protein [Planctomycetota bacterium]
MTSLARALAAMTLGALVGLAAPRWWRQGGPTPGADLEVDRTRRAVSFPATLHPDALEEVDPAGHHLVTWVGGRAGHKALLRTSAPDVAVLDALEALGGRACDGLREETWTRRHDPDHPAPDLRAAGSPLAVTVRPPGGQERDVADLLEDQDGQGFDWRLAGNRALIEVWRSGCVVCLQSCPGGRVGNARATLRDHARGRSRFRASALARRLGEGAPLTVTLRLVPRELGHDIRERVRAHDQPKGPLEPGW